MNIDGSQDPYYRYKMPKVQIRLGSKGTEIVNIVNIRL